MPVQHLVFSATPAVASGWFDSVSGEIVRASFEDHLDCIAASLTESGRGAAVVRLLCTAAL